MLLALLCVGIFLPRRRTARREAHVRLRVGPAFVGANVISGLMNLVGLGTLLALTLYLQAHLDQSALRAGLELLPVLLPLAVLGPVSGHITARYGSRLPMSFGLALGAIGSLCLLIVRPGVNNTARQAVGAAGVALYSAVLSHSSTFTTGLHTLAWVGGVLGWLHSASPG